MIKSLQSWRFVFAVMIFLHHFILNGKNLFLAGGIAGVSFFMILSGFVMCAGYGEKTTLPTFSYRSFLTKRLIRIYPLHLICLLLWLVINRDVGVWMIPNILLVQSWIPLREFFFSGNALAWCLSDFLFFYAMFPLLNNIRKKHTSIFIVATLVILFLYIIVISNWQIDKETARKFLYINPLFRITDFMLGMTAFSVYQYISNSKAKAQIDNLSFATKTIVEIMPLILLVLAFIMQGAVEPKFYLASYYWLPMVAIILVFSLVGGGISWFLTRDVVLRVSEVSFTMYMIHAIFMTLTSCVLHRIAGPEIPWQVKLLIEFVVVLGFSFLIYHKFEKPVTAYLKNKLNE